jgi:hypothetical protein
VDQALAGRRVAWARGHFPSDLPYQQKFASTILNKINEENIDGGGPISQLSAVKHSDLFVYASPSVAER